MQKLKDSSCLGNIIKYNFWKLYSMSTERMIEYLYAKVKRFLYNNNKYSISIERMIEYLYAKVKRFFYNNNNLTRKDNNNLRQSNRSSTKYNAKKKTLQR